MKRTDYTFVAIILISQVFGAWVNGGVISALSVLASSIGACWIMYCQGHEQGCDDRSQFETAKRSA